MLLYLPGVHLGLRDRSGSLQFERKLIIAVDSSLLLHVQGIPVMLLREGERKGHCIKFTCKKQMIELKGNS